MPTIKVPDIKIPKVEIPETPYIPETVLIGENPACDLSNRDIELSENPTIIFHGRKAYATCPNGQAIGGTQPIKVQPEAKTFRPIVYDAQDTIETEGTYNYQKKGSANNLNVNQKEEKEIELVPCPPKSPPYRPGDWRNELRLERLVKYERGLLEGSCDAIWEEVPFVDQYIPTASVVVSTAVIASVAATTPVILQLVKPLVKNLIKKLTKKKDKVE
jgi:hypothetical protein